MSRCTLDPASLSPFSHTGLSPALAGFPKTILLKESVDSAVRTPGCSHPGLGSSGFARRYSRNRCFFLFLRLLRCFSSPGSLHTAMDSLYGDRSSSGRVSPFRHPRIDGYLLLPVAFRSLSRLSSALSAKASTLRSYLLDLFPDLRSGVCHTGTSLPLLLWRVPVDFFPISNRGLSYRNFSATALVAGPC